jgi:hypothetical protein
MEQQITLLEKNGEKMGFFTIWDPRTRSSLVTDWQKKVMQHFGIPINYIEINYRVTNHGGAIEAIIKGLGNNADYVTFFDNDAIPLKREVIDIIYEKLKDKRTVFGGIQNSNHIHENHPLICPSSLSLSTKLYRDLGQPHLGDLIKRSDHCEELVWRCQELGYNICYVYPTSFYELTDEEMAQTGNPRKWNLGNGLFYGLCTQYGDLFFHRGMQNIARGEEIFIAKCKEILDYKENPPKNIKLPDWVEEIKEFFPDKYELFVSELETKTGDNQQYYVLKEFSNRYRGQILGEIGTDRMLGSFVLAQNRQNTVITYDIFNNNPEVKNRILTKYPNLKFRLENLLDNPERAKDFFKNCDFLYIDCDPHNGIIEQEFYKLIEMSGFQGIAVWDDCKLNEGMKNFWSQIPARKIDISEIAHNTGTSITIHHPPKIETIIISVGFGEELSITLPQTKKFFDNVIVLSHESDKLTQEVCKENGVECILTDLFYADGATFDKGRVISYGLTKLKYLDWVCSMDADIYIPDDFKEKLDIDNRNMSQFFGTGRRFVWTYEDWLDIQVGKIDIQDLPYVEGYGCGFWILFNLNSKPALQEPLDKLYPWRPTNDQIDIDFLRKWCPLIEKDPNLGRIDMDLLHLSVHGCFRNGRGNGNERFDELKGKSFKQITKKDIKNILSNI